MSEEGGEVEGREAVVRPGFYQRRVVVEQSAQAIEVPDRGRFEGVEVSSGVRDRPSLLRLPLVQRLHERAEWHGPNLDISINIVTIIIDMKTLDLIDCCGSLGDATLDDEHAEGTATIFKALADPARVKIVNLLARSDEPVCACEFIPALRLTQATVSHHLKKLTDAGLLEREQRGKWAYFSLNPEAVSRLEGLVRIPEVVT
jgi:ArsR family transcriptional regulator